MCDSCVCAHKKNNKKRNVQNVQSQLIVHARMLLWLKVGRLHKGRNRYITSRASFTCSTSAITISGTRSCHVESLVSLSLFEASMAEQSCFVTTIIIPLECLLPCRSRSTCQSSCRFLCRCHRKYLVSNSPLKSLASSFQWVGALMGW